MQTYELTVRERAITRTSNDPTMVRTSRGVDRLHILFDSPEWLDFDLSVAMYNGGVLVESPVTVIPLLGDHLAECYVDVPDEVLESLGALGVTVHGTDENDNHIITERAFPFTVEQEGDEEGIPVIPIEIKYAYLPDDAEIAWKRGGRVLVISWIYDELYRGVVIDTHGQQATATATSRTYWQIGTCYSYAILPTVITTNRGQIGGQQKRVPLSHRNIPHDSRYCKYLGIVSEAEIGSVIELEIELA